MKTTYEPDTLAGRLQVFFEANPDEELTTSDICAKFGVTAKTVGKALLHKPCFVSDMRLESSITGKQTWMNVWRYIR